MDNYKKLSDKPLSGNIKLVVARCNITKVEADCIVNPTNSSFSPGQVGADILKVGGEAYKSELENLKKGYKLGLQTGDVAKCRAYNVKASTVLHVVSPTWKNEQESLPALEQVIINILCRAENDKYESLAIPSIGSGNGGFPKDKAAQTILKAIDSFYLETPAASCMNRLYLVLYDEESVKLYDQTYQALQ